MIHSGRLQVAVDPANTKEPRSECPFAFAGGIGRIKKAQGIIHGKTIELFENLGLPDGEQVDVTVQETRGPAQHPQLGEGLRRCAGALADSWTEEDDRILDLIHQERRQ